jgi:1-acyl-sn-glycerol-3-phosphate acyltransferase
MWKRSLLALFGAVYGVYATLACAMCLVLGGVLVLALPVLQWRRRVAREVLRLTFVLAAMPYRVEAGMPLRQRPYVVIANHRSYLDGLALMAALPADVAPVIKHEMATVPALGGFLRHLGCRFVTRAPASAAGRDTRELLQALESGQSLAIFPEGTFSPDRGLLPFHDGAFFLAAKAGVPVIPLIIEGSRKVLAEHRYLPRPGWLVVRVLDAIRPDGDGREAIAALREEAEHRLSRGLRHAAPAEGVRGHGYYVQALAGRALPLAYVDLDLLEQNIRSLLARSGNKQLRVDARLLPCPALLQRVLRAPARFEGVLCSGIEQALGLCRVDDLADVRVASPTLQVRALEAACGAIHEGCRLSLTVDAAAHVSAAAQAAQRVGVVLPLCVEVDLGNAAGHGAIHARSAIRDTAAMLRLVRQIDAAAGVRLAGICSLDLPRDNRSPKGNNAGTPSRQRTLRGHRRVHAQRHALATALRGAGHDDFVFACDGIGGMAFNAGHTDVTEIIIGHALLGLDPEGTRALPAAGCAAEVVRQLDARRYACMLDGVDVKASDAAWPQPFLPRGMVLDHARGDLGAQLPLRSDRSVDIGDMVLLHPAHFDACCRRFGRLLLVQDGAVVGEAETYRA